jgi:glycosyltransferase involved in cell wall biosynthesis
MPIYEFAAANDIPLFVACGEGDDALEELIHSLSDLQVGQLSAAVKGVISVSSENKRKCIEYGLAKDEDIEVFPNCVNTSIFHKLDVSGFRKQLGISDDDFVIGFVGGFIPRKGPDRIAKAITKLNDPHIKVMFIGKPFPGYPYDFDCPGIIYKGPLDHELLPQYVNCADVFVMPTQKEGCCNAIVEALAMGIPVISSNGTFNDDILDDKNSIRLDPNDVDAIAAAIKLLKDNPSLCQSMSEYSLSKHDEYSISGRAMRILNFIHRQVNSK